MSLKPITAQDAVRDLGAFDAVIDVRSPAEYAEDHLPGAINLPVLDDAQRHTVGTLYVQVSPHEARKVGAALVARNIAGHLERVVHDKPRDWQPLVYCWRGGQRSGSMALVLGQIGFRTRQLDGGYKAFRAIVRDELETLPGRLDLHVVAGRTGSGKTRLLHALAAEGAQVLDLEALACHRGSILGGLPGTPQPSQKRFDTLLWQALRGFDPARPVYVESESQHVGKLRVSPALIQRMRETARCLTVEMPDTSRVALLLEEYRPLTEDVAAFCALLDGLVELRGKDTVRGWQQLARAGRWDALLPDLMARHYDPLYERSMSRHFSGLAKAQRVALADGDPHTLKAAAKALLHVAGRQAGSSSTPEPPPGGGPGEP